MRVPFASILGHEYAREGLWRAMSEGRLHHAILLHGLHGIGKRTLALEVARALLCEAPDQGPCDACSHCHRAAQNVHPDLVVLGREDILGIADELVSHADKRAGEKKERVGKQIDVEYMRGVGDWLSERPWEAKRRVAVVVDSERMNVQAANAFLKSLEEPAPGAVVFLTASTPSFLRPTIRSRCAAIHLGGIPQNLMERHLIDRGVEPFEARLQAQASGGSLARALESREALDDLRDQLLLALAGGRESALAAYQAASLAAGKEADRDETLHLFATLLRDIAVLRMGARSESLIHSDAASAIARAADSSLDPFALFSKVVDARERVAGNANRVLLWDDLLHEAASGR